MVHSIIGVRRGEEEERGEKREGQKLTQHLPLNGYSSVHKDCLVLFLVDHPRIKMVGWSFFFFFFFFYLSGEGEREERRGETHTALTLK